MASIVIKIGDKEVGFKATAGIFYRYKENFKREYLEDVYRANKIANGAFVTQIQFNTVWVLAKTYDENIPPVQEWLDSFDFGEFKIDEVYEKCQTIMKDNYKIDRKN